MNLHNDLIKYLELTGYRHCTFCIFEEFDYRHPKYTMGHTEWNQIVSDHAVDAFYLYEYKASLLCFGNPDDATYFKLKFPGITSLTDEECLGHIVASAVHEDGDDVYLRDEIQRMGDSMKLAAVDILRRGTEMGTDE